MRRLVLLLAVLLLASGCVGQTSIQGKPVAQQPLDVQSPFEPKESDSQDPSETPDTAPIDGEAQGVCAELKWTDLPYPDAKADAPPTQINYDSTFDQSCRWTTKVNGTEVGVSLRFREGREITIERTTGEYEVKGKKVTYLDRSDDPEVQASCVLVAPYAGGGLGIIVIDSTGKFGTVCEQGKKIAEKLIERES
jgi:hypothetical protein